MPARLVLLVGTRKGAFLMQSDADRRDWHLSGPFCDTAPINHMIGDPATGAIYAAGGNPWLGPAVWRSNDLGATWRRSAEGLGYAAGEPAVAAAWSLALSGNGLFVGVEPAGLFRSDDGGASFTQVTGLRDHPSREMWQPGGGGLILHHVVAHPDDARQLWVGISTAGVFHTADGGATWTPRNRGTRADYLPEEQRYPEVGQCVHALDLAPGRPQRLYQQNHCGMYRSDDGGLNWTSIEKGLPSSFGFPCAAHPRDADTLYLAPLNGDILGRYMPEARATVWRTGDGGDTWAPLRTGLPQQNAYFGVLRQALAVDRFDPAGVYLGTTSGKIYASADEGETWRQIAEDLPTISSVETLVIG